MSRFPMRHFVARTPLHRHMGSRYNATLELGETLFDDISPQIEGYFDYLEFADWQQARIAVAAQLSEGEEVVLDLGAWTVPGGYSIVGLRTTGVVAPLMANRRSTRMQKPYTTGRFVRPYRQPNRDAFTVPTGNGDNITIVPLERPYPSGRQGGGDRDGRRTEPRIWGRGGDPIALTSSPKDKVDGPPDRPRDLGSRAPSEKKHGGNSPPRSSSKVNDRGGDPVYLKPQR